MANRKFSKYIAISPDAIGINRYVRRYKDHHSKFVHSSWLLKEDWGREVVLPNEDDIEQVYTIYGMWALEGNRVKIMLKAVEGGPFLLEDSKVVAQALGYRRMRNAVTGAEYEWDYIPSNRLWQLSPEGGSRELEKPEVYFRDDEAYVTEDEAEEEAYIDPLVKALQDDIEDE